MGCRKQKRNAGTNYVELPSDEETEIESHAHQDPISRKTYYDYLAFQTKRTRSNLQGPSNLINTPTTVEADTEEVSDTEKTRYQVSFESPIL